MNKIMLMGMLCTPFIAHAQNAFNTLRKLEKMISIELTFESNSAQLDANSLGVFYSSAQQLYTAKEVVVAQEILQTMGIRSFTPLVTACPGCGRTTSTYFQELALEIQTFLRESMPQWKNTYPGVEDMSVAVMGCVVNGPGESKLANIGISLPGTGEIPVAPVFVDGEKTVTLKGENIANEFKAIVMSYVESHYSKLK